jgi:hypothetical protein
MTFPVPTSPVPYQTLLASFINLATFKNQE